MQQYASAAPDGSSCAAAADGFSAFEEAGLANGPAVVRTGMRYRATVLALGGGVPPGEVFSVRSLTVLSGCNKYD